VNKGAKELLGMRKPLTVVVSGLLAIALMCSLTSPAAAAKNAKVSEEVAVLLKWYHTYFQEGKYEQAEHVAELAHELAPDDPEARVALKVVRRQLSRTSASASSEQHLDRVLSKIDTLERHVYDLETEKQRLQRQLAACKRRSSDPPGRHTVSPPVLPMALSSALPSSETQPRRPTTGNCECEILLFPRARQREQEDFEMRGQSF
jgi:hypothetical protein